MREFFVSALALGLATSVAMATEPTEDTSAKVGPVELTEAQMDGVTAGALVNVVAVDAVDANVAANVQANVLGRAIQSGSSEAQNLNPVAVAGTLN